MRLLAGRSYYLSDELKSSGLPRRWSSVCFLASASTNETGAGVLLVEQHVNLALKIADRAIALSHGDVVLEGDAASLRDDRSLLVASYMGEQAPA